MLLYTYIITHYNTHITLTYQCINKEFHVEYSKQKMLCHEIKVTYLLAVIPCITSSLWCIDL